jgi:hypothetical protein
VSRFPSTTAHWITTRIIPLAAIACLIGYVYAYGSGRPGLPIRSDAFSYFVYLPSWFLYHDPTLQDVADDCCAGEFPAWTAIIRWPRTHQWVNAHPIGQAVMMAPFFGVAHVLTWWTNLTPDGFSLYYQHAAGLAGLGYAIAGLWFLRRLLLRYYTPGVTTATIVTLLGGTSLYHYATFDSTWSHAFSFALFSAILERIDAWRRGSAHADVAIAFLAGLMTLVRHVNVLFPAILVGALALRSWQQREPGWPGGRLALTTAGATALMMLPQLWLYRLATRHWLISSYGNLGFTFLTPHIAGVLVSAQKGLFFWAPVLLIALPGLFMLPGRLRDLAWPLVIFLIADTYLIASWWDWQFGGSFGHRAFVDAYPVFALGLAASYARLAERPAPTRLAATAAITCLCVLSTFQMLQYWHGVLPIADLTWAQYKTLFLRPW